MKAVLISIQPKWCELIASGKKTVEVRKTKPKFEATFKCYIYCTSSNVHECLMQNEGGVTLIYACNYKTAIPIGGNISNGKVIGEFMCRDITEYEGEFWDDETQETIKKVIHTTDSDGYPELDYSFIAENGKENSLCKSSCLTWEELRNYIGQGINTFYGWHISDLVIYDKPKELSEFRSYNVKASIDESGYPMPTHEITRPPQSWCYVEELEGKG